MSRIFLVLHQLPFFFFFLLGCSETDSHLLIQHFASVPENGLMVWVCSWLHICLDDRLIDRSIDRFCVASRDLHPLPLSLVFLHSYWWSTFLFGPRCFPNRVQETTLVLLIITGFFCLFAGGSGGRTPDPALRSRHSPSPLLQWNGECQHFIFIFFIWNMEYVKWFNFFFLHSSVLDLFEDVAVSDGQAVVWCRSAGRFNRWSSPLMYLKKLNFK